MKTIFLTFDDGPSVNGTPQTLELLKKHQAQATFFVIGKKAKQQPKIIQSILNEQHAVYSHSDNHQYTNYFKNKTEIGTWMKKSIRELNELMGRETNFFRPPAGILTPPLVQVAEELKIPLILWSQRFFDSTWKITPHKILKKIERFQSGDIVLLHDHQKSDNLESYLESLDVLLKELTSRGFLIRAIN